MKKFLFSLILFLIVLTGTIVIVRVVPANADVDDGTKKACRWYADLDHEKEIAPDRYKAYKDMVVNFNWYKSCIGEIQYPVAGGAR